LVLKLVLCFSDGLLMFGMAASPATSALNLD
jgi:hypothetical protein